MDGDDALRWDFHCLFAELGSCQEFVRGFIIDRDQLYLDTQCLQ